MLNNNSLMEEIIPLEFYLSQNYPNPFKDKTTIKYCVAFKTRVKLKVYDAEGREIEKLVDDVKCPGTYEIEFRTTDGSWQLASGNYTYRLEAGDYKCEKKMEMIK